MSSSFSQRTIKILQLTKQTYNYTVGSDGLLVLSNSELTEIDNAESNILQDISGETNNELYNESIELDHCDVNENNNIVLTQCNTEEAGGVVNYEDDVLGHSQECYKGVRSGTSPKNSDVIFEDNNVEEIIENEIANYECTVTAQIAEDAMEIEIIPLKENFGINETNEATNIIENEIGSNNKAVKRQRANKWDMNKNKWGVNVNKKRRERGTTYKGRKNNNGKISYDIPKEKRTMKGKCNCKSSLKKNSRLKCREFSEEERTAVFRKFWKGLNWKEKKMYISCSLEMKETSRARNRKEETSSRRQYSVEYYMSKGETKYRVCKTMFLNTHGIGEYSALQWKKENNQLGQRDLDSSPERTEPEQSRKRQARNETLKMRVDCLQLFFKELPKVESHYCRASTSKLYLEPVWKSKRSLYDVYAQEWCGEKNVKPLSIFTFEKYFAKLNLSLYIPKKDQCEICAEHEVGNLDDTKFHEHQIRKTDARKEKQIDKESNNLVYTVDVQAVLLSPLSNVSANYFRTKLITHNYTIFDLKTHDGFCYLWNESEGGVTGDNFASLLCDFLVKEVIPKRSGEQEIILYSDGCASQNRNTTLANALLNISVLYSVTIIQKYLEIGHTQMEVDTMHSVIERRMRNIKINVPADYEQICKTARKKPHPYNVLYVSHEFFKDFSQVQIYPNIRPGKKVGDPQVSDLRQLKYTQEAKIYYKLNHPDPWNELECRVKNIPCVDPKQLPRLYKSRLPIKKTKYDHLQYLKRSLLPDYHTFYDELPFQAV